MLRDAAVGTGKTREGNASTGNRNIYPLKEAEEA
jgi:hypothetical protein